MTRIRAKGCASEKEETESFQAWKIEFSKYQKKLSGTHGTIRGETIRRNESE